MHAILHTSKWPINLELHIEQTPHTVANFVTLARNGFYDGLQFHRVIEEFMVQWWCPQGTGTGGPGYQFADEFHPDLRHSWPGILSMANSWPNSNGSQFFITHIATDWLDDKHTVFGKIISQSDLEIINTIAQWDLIDRVEISESVTLPEEVLEFAQMIQDSIDG